MEKSPIEVTTLISDQPPLPLAEETNEGWTYHPYPSGDGGYWTRPVDPEIVAKMPVLQEDIGFIERARQWLKPLF